MIELESDNLNELASQNKKMFVMFGASWCGMCKMTKPKVKRLANEADYPFVYVDAEKLVESRNFVGGVDNLPSFVGIVNGEVVSKDFGSKSIDKILESLI